MDGEWMETGGIVKLRVISTGVGNLFQYWRIVCATDQMEAWMENGGIVKLQVVVTGVRKLFSALEDRWWNRSSGSMAWHFIRSNIGVEIWSRPLVFRYP
jgi:hypothetical protein